MDIRTRIVMAALMALPVVAVPALAVHAADDGEDPRVAPMRKEMLAALDTCLTQKLGGGALHSAIIEACDNRMLVASGAYKTMIESGITGDMANAAWTREEAWDAQLNKAYGKAMAACKEQAPQKVELLRKSQRAWITFRDAEVALVGATEGSISRVLAPSTQGGMTAERAMQLFGIANDCNM